MPERSQTTVRIGKTVGAFVFVDVLFRVVVPPSLLAIDPTIHIGTLAAWSAAILLISYAVSYAAAWPIVRWWRERSAVARIVAARKRFRTLPTILAAIYAVSWLTPVARVTMAQGHWNLSIALVLIAASLAPMPLAYSLGVQLAAVLAPDLDEHERAAGVTSPPRDLGMRGRVLLVGLCLALAPSSYMAGLGEAHSVGHELPTWVLMLTLAGVLAYAVICASMFAADFLAAQQAAEHLNAELEKRVEERTQSLATTHRALASEMESRLTMELELRQASKLEAVGRLAAGIAHEINSPLQYVRDSITFLDEANLTLAPLLGAYRALGEQVASCEHCKELAAHIEQIETRCDAFYVMTEIPGAIERSVEGLSRVNTIVRSMNHFAHADGAEMSSVELNEAVKSTLVIARSEFKYVADLETNYGELPPVPCYAGEINQVVLNLVVNAAHAISDKVAGTQDRGRITVSTRCAGNAVEISVADTGGGISPAIRERIFDPFFTTKHVGRGTGQGLAIARAVAQKHHGSLAFETVEGEGTTFVLRLPLAA